VSAETEAFVSELATAFPQLDPLLAEHLESNNGGMLPHMFVADVARWAISSYADPKEHAELRRLFAFLERGFAQSSSAAHNVDDVRELLTDSFLEILPRPKEPGAGIDAFLGPAMHAEMEARFGVG